jgi:hypothetical protein
MPFTTHDAMNRSSDLAFTATRVAADVLGWKVALRPGMCGIAVLHSRY